jgi:ActR/RegA family two-component response regulator
MGNRGRFLVVDDDPCVVRHLARVVRRFGDAAIAQTVREAKALLAASPSWRAFFVDLGLPDGSGLDVLVPARAAFPDVPAMVLTGNVEPALINAVHDLGAHYVVKPIDVARIERFCLSVVAPQRAKADDSTTPPDTPRAPGTLEECVARMREFLAVRPDALVRYAMGKIVATIKDNPDVYGRSGVSALAAAIGEDAPTLYRHAAVTECWTEAEVRELCVRKGRDGRPLSWSHIVLFGSVASEPMRAELVERALDAGLSVRQLTALIEEWARAPGSRGPPVPVG